MTLTPEQIRHIADLARLELTEAEVQSYCAQLSAILEYFQHLQILDTDNIVPILSGVDLQGGLRSDQPMPGLGLEELLRNAADVEKNLFRVPPIFD